MGQDSERQVRVVGVGDLIGGAIKLLVVVLMIATPLIGVWVSSSLAAYFNQRPEWVVAAGALLFPVGPLLWEGFAAWRRSRRKAPGPRVLTFFDRLVLRTLVMNVAFLAVMLARYPQQGFVALATRGDWMLEGRHDPLSEGVRQKLLVAAGGLEWLYKWAHDNPYRRPDEVKKDEGVKKGEGVKKDAAGDATGKTGEGTAEAKGPVWPMPSMLHPIVAAMPPEAETSIEAVGRYIAEREKDPVMRVKAIHDYVADRIAYDVAAFEGYRAGIPIPREAADAEPVFRNRRGVCAGYADLVREIANVTGDEVLYVVGDARTMGATVEGLGHAWNAVKVKGRWMLLDATWDAGSVSEKEGFKKRYSSDYLFTPPEVFGVTHFPENVAQQYRAQPISRTEFLRQPLLRPSFYRYGLELVSPTRSQVPVTGAIEVEVKNPRGVYVWLNWGAPGGKQEKECGEPSRSGRLHCALPAEGTFDLGFFVNDKRTGSYEWVGGIEVTNRRL